MYRFVFENIKPITKKQKYAVRSLEGKTFTNKKKALSEMAKSARFYNITLRNLNSIFADALTINQRYIFDLPQNLIMTYSNFVTSINETFVQFITRPVNEFLVNRTLKNLANTILNYIYFCKKNFAKIKYTGYAYAQDLQIQTLLNIKTELEAMK